MSSSTTFTNKQIWIMVGLFALLIVFTIYNSIANSVSRQESENQRQQILNQTKVIEQKTNDVLTNDDRLLGQLTTNFNTAYKQSVTTHINITKQNHDALSDIQNILKDIQIQMAQQHEQLPRNQTIR